MKLMGIEIPEIGDPFTIEERSGYKLWQRRPFECRRGGCKCEADPCNGTVTEYPGEVVDRTFWGDNSVDVIVLCEDGEKRRAQVVPPHGDLCF